MQKCVNYSLTNNGIFIKLGHSRLEQKYGQDYFGAYNALVASENLWANGIAGKIKKAIKKVYKYSQDSLENLNQRQIFCIVVCLLEPKREKFLMELCNSNECDYKQIIKIAKQIRWIMIKVIDIDALFDKYIEEYVYKNVGKVKVEEIEDNIPVLYEKFGKEKLAELDGKTPEEYYLSFSAEQLLECFSKHIELDVSMPDFLYEALLKKDCNALVFNRVLSCENEEELAYLLNLAGDKGVEGLEKRYLELVLFDYSEGVCELATELLSQNANNVKEEVINAYQNASDSKRLLLLEVLSKCERDDRIFDILIEQFVTHLDNLPLYVSYITKYGDERALPFLKTAIENDKINYADFEELRFAIEALGGVCDIKRDFSADKVYKAIKKTSQKN